ncbi:uncharacterized protein CPUR_08866 [Claviceps purpurea 20.1]|uniref:DUF6570 domain-containing protein n=1 Tax=Claviceps purpurea (strain 20.1) TaxID=1111077 RepID=M1VZH2_CLAP2|nr:uncharacterized protein CPUR_08866 [Claviceps purpurea 20.1]
MPPVPTPDEDVPYIEGTTTLDDLAITDTDIDRIKSWSENLDKNKQQRCHRCNCFWFGLEVVSGICASCQKADTIYQTPTRGQRGPGMPELWSAENKLDMGVVPADLPQLDQIEEWLISRVHVHVQIWTYRGSQYRYKGHVISFLKDVGTVYDTLPLLPSELDTIVVRPRNTTSEPGMIRQFRSAFRVRRGAIAQWLNWLVRNNPLYRDVVVDPARLQQLPVDGDVGDQLPTIEADAVQAEQEMRDAAATDNVSSDADELWEGAAVPHLMAHQTDVDAFKERILQGPDAPATQATSHAYPEHPTDAD